MLTWFFYLLFGEIPSIGISEATISGSTVCQILIQASCVLGVVAVIEFIRMLISTLCGFARSR